MKHFLLFIAMIFAVILLLANLGPLIIFAACLWFLYLIFKQFIKTDSVFTKVMWVILAIVIASIALPNAYGVIGLIALLFLYYICKKGKEEEQTSNRPLKDPFLHFEEQWDEFYK